MIKIKNLWNESKVYKYNNFFEVCSNFNNSRVVNAPNKKTAIEAFRRNNPNVKNKIDCKNFKLLDGHSLDVNYIIEY